MLLGQLVRDALVQCDELFVLRPHDDVLGAELSDVSLSLLHELVRVLDTLEAKHEARDVTVNKMAACTNLSTKYYNITNKCDKAFVCVCYKLAGVIFISY